MSNAPIQHVRALPPLQKVLVRPAKVFCYTYSLKVMLDLIGIVVRWYLASGAKRGMRRESRKESQQENASNNASQRATPSARQQPLLNQLPKALRNLDFAAFIAVMPLLYHSSQFTLSRIPTLQRRPGLRAFISGCVSGLAIRFDITRARDLATYFGVRAIAESILYFHDKGAIFTVPYADVLLFCSVLTVIMSIFVYSPSLFRPLYYRLFLRFEGEDRFIVKYARYSFREYVVRTYLGGVAPPLWLKEQEEEMRKRGELPTKEEKRQERSASIPKLHIKRIGDVPKSQGSGDTSPSASSPHGLLATVPPTPVTLAPPDAREMALFTFGSPLRHKTPPPK